MAIIGQGIINAGALTGGVGSIDAATLQGHPASYFTPMVVTAGISGAVANLQQQMSGVQNLTSRVVFKEAFTGNGIANTFNLNGTILNGAFATGAWGSGYIVLSLTAYITDLNGQVIYDSLVPLYRDKIQVTSVDSSGLVTTDFIPRAGQQGYIWYWYQLTTTDSLSYYYREDFVTYAESEAGTDVATAVYVGPSPFSNIVVKNTDVTVDDALHALDSYVAAMSGNSNGFTPFEGDGMTITVSGSDYIFSVTDYISKTDVANISGGLQSQIDNMSVGSTTIASSGGSIFVNQIGNHFNLEVASAPVSNHNSLLGLQGGTANEYYHLTQSEYANISGNGDIYTSEVLLHGINVSPGYEIKLDNTLSYIWSSGRVYGFDLIDNGNGTVNISGGAVMLRDSSSTSPFYGNLIPCAISATLNISLVDNETNYIYADYNSGSPILAVNQDLTTINARDNVLIYSITRVGTSLYYLPLGSYQADFMAKYAKKMAVQRGYEYGAGAIVTESDTRKLDITAGMFYYVNDLIATPAINTNTGGATFTYCYRSATPGLWTRVNAQTTIDRDQYDDGSGTLQTLGISNFGCHWLFLVLDSPTKLLVVYGQDKYTTNADATNAPLPATLPPEVHQYSTGTFIAKIITQRNKTSFISIGQPFISSLSYATANTHNMLGGLQGGTADEYYHHTLAQYNDFIGKTEVASISGSLNTLIANETAARVAADLLLTPLSTTASISGNLQQQITDLNTNAVHKTGTETISGDKTFVDTINFSTLTGDRVVVTSSSKNLASLGAGTSTQVLHGNLSGPPIFGAVVEADLQLSNNTTADVSVAAHGFAPKLSGNITQFFRGDGVYATPAGVASAYLSQTFSLQTSVNVNHLFGAYPIVQVIDISGSVLVPETISNTSLNSFTVTFNTARSGTILASLGSPQLSALILTATDYSTSISDKFVEVSAIGKTVTLHNPALLSAQIMVITNASAGNINVTGNINGSLQTIPLATTNSLSVYSNGSTFRVY